MEEFRAISDKLVKKRELLVYGKCGSTPDERSYGLRASGPRDVLGETMYKKDLAIWEKCADKQMATKHKKEDKEITDEMINALKRAEMR